MFGANPPPLSEDDIYAAEDEWGRRAFAAIKRGEDYEGHMQCPTCGRLMDVVRRSRRLTLAGWEPACIQYGCDRKRVYAGIKLRPAEG